MRSEFRCTSLCICNIRNYTKLFLVREVQNRILSITRPLLREIFTYSKKWSNIITEGNPHQMFFVKKNNGEKCWRQIYVNKLCWKKSYHTTKQKILQLQTQKQTKKLDFGYTFCSKKHRMLDNRMIFRMSNQLSMEINEDIIVYK